MFYLILLYFGSVGSCIENFVMLELRQSFQAKYHDGKEDDEDRDDRHNSGMLAGLRVLKQQPHFALEVICWKGLFLLLDESFIFPEIKQFHVIQSWTEQYTTIVALCAAKVYILYFLSGIIFIEQFVIVWSRDNFKVWNYLSIFLMSMIIVWKFALASEFYVLPIRLSKGRYE